MRPDSENPTRYILQFYALLGATALLVAIFSISWIGVYAILIFVVLTPWLAWKTVRAIWINPDPRFAPRLFRGASLLVMSIAWISAIHLGRIAVPLAMPWPLSEYQHYAVEQDWRERGYIPGTAVDVLVRDNHGGFHGDGYRFVTFIYQEDSIDDLRLIADLNRSFAVHRPETPQVPWQDGPLDDKATYSVRELVEDFDIEPAYRPVIESRSQRFFCARYSDFLCETLYIYEPATKRFWALQMTF